MTHIKQFLAKFKRTYLCRHKWTMLKAKMRVAQGGVRMSFTTTWPTQIAYEGNYRILRCAKCGANHLIEDADVAMEVPTTTNKEEA